MTTSRSWLDDYFSRADIEDGSGNVLTSRGAIQFAGAGLSCVDDPDNDRTVVSLGYGPPTGSTTHVMASLADNATPADNAAAIVDVSTGTATADFVLTFTPPTSATSECLRLVANETPYNCTVGIGSGTTYPVGAGLSQLLRFRTTGVFNAITGA